MDVTFSGERVAIGASLHFADNMLQLDILTLKKQTLSSSGDVLWTICKINATPTDSGVLKSSFVLKANTLLTWSIAYLKVKCYRQVCFSSLQLELKTFWKRLWRFTIRFILCHRWLLWYAAFNQGLETVDIVINTTTEVRITWVWVCRYYKCCYFK